MVLRGVYRGIALNLDTGCGPKHYMYLLTNNFFQGLAVLYESIRLIQIGALIVIAAKWEYLVSRNQHMKTGEREQIVSFGSMSVYLFLKWADVVW